MDVKIKDFKVNMDVKSSGIEFEVRKPKGGGHIGDCYLTMTGLTWCSGRTGRTNGVDLKWADRMTILDSSESRKAAVKAARDA